MNTGPQRLLLLGHCCRNSTPASGTHLLVLLLCSFWNFITVAVATVAGLAATFANMVADAAAVTVASSSHSPYPFPQISISWIPLDANWWGIPKCILQSSHYCGKSFSGISDGKESAYSAGDLGSISGLGRPPREGHGNPLQYSCLQKPVDRGAWQATVQGIAKSQTWLSN